MVEAVRIVAECDGYATPWEGAARLYRFLEGTELLLLRSDDPRFLKVAYDNKPLFVPRGSCILIEVASASALAGPPGRALQPRPAEEPPRWRAREKVALVALTLLLPCAAFLVVPAAFHSLTAAVAVWLVVALLVSGVVGTFVSRRAALWGAAAGTTLAVVLASLIVVWLSSLEI
jgi:hypothetical protein